MNSDFFKMAAQPPIMSTPVKGKCMCPGNAIPPSSRRLRFFPTDSLDITHENSEALTMGSPKNGSPIPSSVPMSPCRHSLRLLANGYYECNEDSFCWDDLGNVSFSPTQCTVSYKENMVRIFRKRRRTPAQRRLDLVNHGHLEDRQPPHYEDINAIEPLVFEQIHHSSPDLCDSENTDVYSPCLLEATESDTDLVSCGYSQNRNKENSAQCHPETAQTIVFHGDNSTKMLQRKPKSSIPVLTGIPQHVNNECRFSYDISSCRPIERRPEKPNSPESTPTTLTPSIESVPMHVDDTRHSWMIDVALFYISLFLLCLIVWWVRSPEHGVKT